MKKILALILSLSAFVAVQAQRDVALYNLNNVFQSRYQNPAFQPQSKIQIGLPAISSLSVGVFNTGFKIGGIYDFSGNEESEDVDVDAFKNDLQPLNTLGTEINLDLISVGFGLGKGRYFSLYARERIQADFLYPGDLMLLILEGNGGDFLGRRINADGLGLNLNVYSELAAGYTHRINDQLTVGTNIKYLIGQANSYTEKSELGITTTENPISLQLDGSLDFRTSGFTLSEIGNLDSTLLESAKSIGNNSGIGIDLGATYNYNKFTFGASILDIGSIKWSEESSYVYQNENLDFTYDGIDFFDFTSSESDPFQELLDSLESVLETEETQQSYTTPIKTQLVLSAAYNLTPKSDVGIVIRNSFRQESGQLSASAYYAVDVKNWLTATINASYLNRGFGNLGVGLMAKAGPVQFYVLTDNIAGVFAPESTRNIGGRFGINLVFGKRKDLISTPEVVPSDTLNPAPTDTATTAPSKRELRKRAKEAKKLKEAEEEEESGLEYITPAELKEQEKKEAEEKKNTKKAPEKDAKKAPKKKKAKVKKPKKKKKDDADFDNWNEPEVEMPDDE